MAGQTMDNKKEKKTINNKITINTHGALTLHTIYKTRESKVNVKYSVLNEVT